MEIRCLNAFAVKSGQSLAPKRCAQPKKMDRFLKLNKHKLRFAFFATSITFLTIVIIILAIGYFNEQFPDIVLLTIVLLGAGIGFPLFIITLAYLEWLSKRRVRKRAFSKPPFDRLDKIGFSKSFINEKTKWFFTEESKEVVINDFKIKCDITRNNSKTIQFKALVNHRQIDKDEFKHLERHFKNQDIIFDFEGLIKMYDIKRPTIVSAQQLESDLIKFTELLKKENFEPQK